VNFFEHARTLYRRRHVLLRARSSGGLRSLEAMCDRREPRARIGKSIARGSLGRRRRACTRPRSFAALATHATER